MPSSDHWTDVHADLRVIDANDDGFSGMLGLEEIPGHLFSKLHGSISTKQSTKQGSGDEYSMDESDAPTKPAKKKSKKSPKPVKNAAPVPSPKPTIDMRDWVPFELHEHLLHGLSDAGFSSPTEIQSQTYLPAYRDRRDVVAASQTGSGKTLAFGLPILNRLLNDSSPPTGESRGLLALVVTPTRELAIQIVQHLKAVAKYTSFNITPIVGGLAQPKQRRMLGRSPEIVVATPGRLWELIQEGESHLCKMSSLQFLVIDEADRMVSRGHYKELDQVLAFIAKCHSPEKSSDKLGEVTNHWQTLLFSATLTTAVNSSNAKRAPSSTLTDLIERIKFRSKPLLVDCSTSTRMASGLTESRIQCLPEEKDLYMFYFLTRHAGRTLVFVNSIACLRRFVGLFSLMKFPVYPLHASMQQRQRLKNLDRFKANDHCVLVCTDVAARGLDIPNVEHVVHYQISSSSDDYVHRAGRTARAAASGLSVLLVSPQEQALYKRITRDLSHSVAEFPVDTNMLIPIRKRVSYAQKLDKLLAHDKKELSEADWFKKNAMEMDILLDDDIVKVDDDRSAREQKRHVQKIQSMRANLDAMMADALVPRGVSRSFITANEAVHGTRDFADPASAAPAIALVPKAHAATLVGKILQRRQKRPRHQ